MNRLVQGLGIAIVMALFLLVTFSAPQVSSDLNTSLQGEMVNLQVGESAYLANMVATSPTRLITIPANSESADAHISSMQIEQTAQALKAVRRDVVNANTSERRTLTIGYVIVAAHHPDAWNNPVYTSPESSIPLEIGQTMPVLFDVPGELPPASYVIGAWVSGQDGEPIITITYDFNLLPPFTFTLPSADSVAPFTLTVSQMINPQLNTFGASFALTNNTASPRVVSVFYSVVSRLDSLTPWSDAVYQSPVRFMSISAGDTYVFVDDQNINAPPGAYRVIAWLHEMVDGQLQLRAAFSENLNVSVS